MNETGIKFSQDYHADNNGGNADVLDDLPPPPLHDNAGNDALSNGLFNGGSAGEDDNASSTISPTTTTNGSSIGLSHIHNTNIQQAGSGQRLLVSPRPMARKNGLPSDIQVHKSKAILYDLQLSDSLNNSYIG